MKHANILWHKRAKELGLKFRQVNFVHDEWQTEVYGTYEDAVRLASIQRASIVVTGKKFRLNCPLSGSSKIGRNWLDTH